MPNGIINSLTKLSNPIEPNKEDTNLSQQFDVGLIPWVHNIQSTVHKDAIRYISQIPKNSTLLIEASPTELSFFYALFNLINNKPVNLNGLTKNQQAIISKLIRLRNKYGIERVRKGFDTEAYADLEVIALCISRNIKLEPLDVEIYRAQDLKREVEKETDSPLERQKRYVLREQGMKRQILRQLNSRVMKPIYVLVGMGHLPHLDSELRNSRLRTKIDKTFISDEEYYGLHELYAKELRKEYYANNTTGILSNEKGIVRLTKTDFEKYSKELEREKTIKRLKEYRIQRQKRLKLRLMNRPNIK